MLRPRTHAGIGLAVLLAALVLAGGSGASGRLASSSVVTGRVEVAHQDVPRPGISRYVPLLVTSKGPVSLRLPQGLPASPGTRITIHRPIYSGGAIVGGSLARLGPPTVFAGSDTLGPANFTPGPRKVLVLLAQVATQPAPGSADAIRDIIFTAPNSANAFIKEETFGQLSLTGKLRSDGDVFGVFPVTSSSPGVCDEVNWGQQAESQFKTETGMDPETWDNVIVVFQAATSICPWSGEAEVGQLTKSRARHAWLNAIGSGGVPTTSVVAHELGHNFGVDHAGGFNCGTGASRIAFSEACATTETTNPLLPDQYLDPFDVMGTGIREESAYHRWESGWLSPSSAETIVRNGRYLLAPEETSMQAEQLFEVPRGANLPSYWLDFRQPFGSFFDSFSPTDPAVNGVTIRYANSSGMPHPAKSWLIDTTPATATFDDAPLAVGRTYSDPARGVSITTVAVSPLGALVDITVANGADTTPPGVASGLSAALSGSTLVLHWTAANDDSGPVQQYIVRRNGVVLSDAYGTSAIDPAPASGRTTTYDISAVDPAGNVGPAATMLVTLPDSTPPSAPTGLVAAVAGAGVRLTWSAALDDIGVASYEVDRDGAAIAAGLGATTLLDSTVGAGAHTYTVRALDEAGNAGPAASVQIVIVAPVSLPTPVAKVRLKTVAKVVLDRLGKHRVLVSWKAQKGAGRYEVMRTSGKKRVLLATVKKVSYLDGRAPAGKLPKSRYVVRALLS